MLPRRTWCESFSVRASRRSYRIPSASPVRQETCLSEAQHIQLDSSLLLSFQPWLFHSFASVVTFPHFFSAKTAWLIREVKELCICGLRWLYCSYQSFPTARELAQHSCFGRRKENCNDFLWGKNIFISIRNRFPALSTLSLAGCKPLRQPVP